jgi:hypothetical protein
MMKIAQCTLFLYGDGNYLFPNGIKIRSITNLTVDIEFAGLVESLLEGWEYEKRVNEKKGETKLRLALSSNAEKTQGEYESLLWDLYSLEIG